VRLLLRAASHQRSGEGDTQIAASPDTLHREAWQWDLRLLDPNVDQERKSATSVALTRSDGSVSHLTLCVDTDVVTPTLEILDLATPVEIERVPDELVAFVVGSGVVLIEGRHVLGELDAMVLAGQDPSSVRVQRLSDERPCVALVRLSPSGFGSLAWVP
jgi:hypothetical protein